MNHRAIVREVSHRQKKINRIVEEIPKLFERLNILVPLDALRRLFYEPPGLPRFNNILAGVFADISPTVLPLMLHKVIYFQKSYDK